MTKRILIVLAIGLFATQIAAQEAKEATQSAEDATEQPNIPPPAPPALYIPPPAPPPIQTTPSIAAEEAADEVAELHRFDPYVTPLDYDSVRPRPSDYPLDAWQADEEGVVAYSVEVNAEGKPTACAIAESSGSSSLDETTCAIIMERAEFNPAQDDSGNPVAGTYADSHYWRKREPEFPGTMTVRVAFDVDENGVTTDCDVLELSGEISDQMKKTFDREPCPGMGRSAQPPFRDQDGNPVARRVELTLSVVVEEPSP